MRNGAQVALLDGDEDLEVVGESYYQDNLWHLAGAQPGEQLVREDIYAVLVAEDDNPYDSNAVAIWINGLKVGHLSRANARRYRPGLLAQQETRGMPIALAGVITGGGIRRDGLGKLGVFLNHDPRDFGLPARSDRISDWGYRSGEPDGPFAGDWFRQNSLKWWNDWCQRRFDELWTDEADRVADDLADEYWFYWPWLIGRALLTGAPATYERILAFAKEKDRPGPAHIDLNPHAISDQIATRGAFHVVRRRRTWPEPSPAVCPTCGQGFWNGDMRPWTIRAFGPVRYCMDCCFRARNGDPRATWFEDEVKAALHDLRDAFGAIPAQNFSAGSIPYDGSPDERDHRIRALLAMPPVETAKRVLGQQDWLGVLRAAGLVGETWRPSRGTWCHASDGHRCRSLLEKAIDDWFTANSVPHECEPRWPRHPELNPSGAKRADWLLSDGTYVECAGMLESKDYAEKIALKQQLARAVGLALIVVGPTDMHKLEIIFRRQLESGQPI